MAYLVYPLNNHPLDLATVADSSSTSRIPRSEVLSGSHDPSGMGRRLTAPSLNRQNVRLLMKVCLSLQLSGDRSLSSNAQTAPHRLPLRTINPPARPLQWRIAT
jgi:hypothetical protein